MKLIIVLLIISTGLPSCYHVYYAPNTANAPLFSEKGETRVNGLYSAGGNSEFSGGELQASHAVSNNAAIMMNAMVVGETATVSDWNGNEHKESGNGSYFELGGGMFKKLDTRGKWIGELFGGAGFGTANNDYGFTDNSKVNSTKFFIQPGVGYKSDYFEVAFVPKVSLVNWKVKQFDITHSNNTYVLDDINAIKSKSGFVAFEPALILRAGGKDFKFQASLSFSNYNSRTMGYSEELIETVNGSIGISLNIKPAKNNK